MVWKMLFEAVWFYAIVDIWMKYFIYSESQCCMMPPIKFLLKRICGLEGVVWKIPRRLFGAWPSFVSEWNERSISESIFGLKHQIKFLLMRTYGLEEDVFFWRISRLQFSSSSSLRSELKRFFIYSEPPCCLLYAQEDVWIWRRNCLKNSKMTVKWMAIFGI